MNHFAFRLFTNHKNPQDIRFDATNCWDKDIWYEVSRTPGNVSGCSELIFCLPGVRKPVLLGDRN
jgi:hypothetical protein